MYTASYPRIKKDFSPPPPPPSSSSSDLFLPTHRRCRRSLLHLITVRHTTLGRNPLYEWSAHRRDLYLKHHSHETVIHAPGWIRTHNSSKRATADPRPWPRDHWGHLNILFLLMVLVWCAVCVNCCLLAVNTGYWWHSVLSWFTVFCSILLIIPQHS